MGGRRSEAEIEAAEQAERVRRAIGKTIAAARRRRGLTQMQLATRLGTNQSRISRLERGTPPLEVGDIIRVAGEVGLTPRIELSRDPLDRPADAGHLAMQEMLVRLARTSHGTTLVELPLGTGDRTRSVDVCVIRRALGELIIEEAWNRIGDVGAGLRSFDRKMALAAEAAVAMPGSPAIVTGVWVVRATRANREVLAAYPALFAARFRGSSRAWVRALVAGAPAPREPGLVLCDVDATRLFEWRPSGIDGAGAGRRSASVGDP